MDKAPIQSDGYNQSASWNAYPGIRAFAEFVQCTGSNASAEVDS